MTDIIREIQEIKEYKITIENDTVYFELYMKVIGDEYLFYGSNPNKELCHIYEKDITDIYLRKSTIEFISERDKCVENIVEECYNTVEDYIKNIRK